MQNYLTAFLIRQVVLRKAERTIEQFIKKMGMQNYLTAAAAVIATVDFALEYPMPLPPIVPVSALILDIDIMQVILILCRSVHYIDSNIVTQPKMLLSLIPPC